MAVATPLVQPNIQNQLIAQMLREGISTAPVQHWTQGAARLANALVGGLLHGQQQQQEREAPNEILRMLQPQQGQQPGAMPAPQQQPAAPPPGFAPAAPQAPPPAANPRAENYPQQRIDNAFDRLALGRASDPTSPMGRYASAIRTVETGGRPNPYAAEGPVINGGRYAGDRAQGAYQAMGRNLPQWTQQALGQQMTPEQFRSAPWAQDLTFESQFDQALQRHGNPQDAASVWFTGRPRAQGANASDQLGTTGAEYVNRFNRALAQQQPAQGVPQQAPAAPASTGAPAVTQAGQPAPQQQAPQGQPQQRSLPQVSPLTRQMLASTNPVVWRQGQVRLMQEINAQPRQVTVEGRVIEIDAAGNPRVVYDGPPRPSETEREREEYNRGRRGRGEPPVDAIQYRQLRERADAQGKASGTSAAAIPQAEGQLQETLTLINQVRSHPGRLHGLSAAWANPSNPLAALTSDQQEWASMVEQAKNGAFLQGIQALRGAGPVTEREGAAAQNAMTRMQRALSKEAFDRALDDYERAIVTGFQKMQEAARGQSNTSGPPPSPVATNAPTAVRRYNPATGRIE